MSYAIIRNAKYKRENLKGIYRHNERKNTNYSNKNIDREKSYLNYAIKSPQYSYEKEFEKIRKKYDLKGQIKKVSNIACEYVITLDNDFFKRIGEEETKRYFETAYKFVCEYKNLGEQYILSAKVHLDEQSPHLHLVFLPVVHTTDKRGNSIDKLACSEFWKEKDSYRRLQNAFYKYMVENGFKLQRGLPKEETYRKHYSVEEYKKITNFENTKKLLQDIKLELPEIPDIKDININRVFKKRDEIIEEQIIKPKDDLIQKLYNENLSLHQELSRKANIINEVEEYQKERNEILANNEDLHNTVRQMEREYTMKSNNLDFDFQNRKNELEKEFAQKEYDIEYKYKHKIKSLEKENNYLNKVVNKFYETIEKFINWICHRFGLGDGEDLIRDFQKETHTFLNAEKQLQKEDKEKDWDLEL